MFSEQPVRTFNNRLHLLGIKEKKESFHVLFIFCWQLPRGSGVLGILGAVCGNFR